MSQVNIPKVWQPARFTQGGIRGLGYDNFDESGVIILNNPLKNKDLLVNTCCRAQCIVCADGGANHLQRLQLDKREKDICLPQAICGDLDSVYPAVLEYYRNQDAEVVIDPDQNSTDLTKCLRYIENHLSMTKDRYYSSTTNMEKMDVAIFGSLEGRADQAFSQLHHLYKSFCTVSSNIGDLYLITPQSLMFLLEKGKNRIHAPVGPNNFTENVGIIPIGRPSVVTTRGLEWDVTSWSTEFGTQISTSNRIRAEVVEVETSERVLFTLENARKPDS